MREIYEITKEDPKSIIREDENSGEVICNCGHQFEYRIGNNMAVWHGFVIPICPECDTVPSSSTRRMDL